MVGNLGLAPPTMEAFCLLVVVGELSAADDLRRRVLMSATIFNIRMLSRKAQETINHLFLHCEVVPRASYHFLKICGMAWCFLGALSEQVQYWGWCLFYGCGLILLRSLVYLEGKESEDF